MPTTENEVNDKHEINNFLISKESVFTFSLPLLRSNTKLKVNKNYLIFHYLAELSCDLLLNYFLDTMELSLEIWLWISLAIFAHIGVYIFVMRKRPKMLVGRHVVITGGSRGIGLCLAVECAMKGANVTVIARDERLLSRFNYIKGYERIIHRRSSVVVIYLY